MPTEVRHNSIHYAAMIANCERKARCLELKLAWVKYALAAPSQFTTPELQTQRRHLLIRLLQQLTAVLTKLYALKIKCANTTANGSSLFLLPLPKQ
jgi:hypothetical protein